jgi:hypothetical protein
MEEQIKETMKETITWSALLHGKQEGGGTRASFLGNQEETNTCPVCSHGNQEGYLLLVLPGHNIHTANSEHNVLGRINLQRQQSFKSASTLFVCIGISKASSSSPKLTAVSSDVWYWKSSSRVKSFHWVGSCSFWFHQLPQLLVRNKLSRDIKSLVSSRLFSLISISKGLVAAMFTAAHFLEGGVNAMICQLGLYGLEWYCSRMLH